LAEVELKLKRRTTHMTTSLQLGNRSKKLARKQKRKLKRGRAFKLPQQQATGSDAPADVIRGDRTL